MSERGMIQTGNYHGERLQATGNKRKVTDTGSHPAGSQVLDFNKCLIIIFRNYLLFSSKFSDT